MPFVHLHTHSHYSLMRGTMGLETLCSQIRALNMDAVALTDTNGLYGAVFFQQVADEAGIRPIIGSEIVTADERAILLVKNKAGYTNLCTLLTQRHCQSGFVLSEALILYHEGLVVLSDHSELLTTLNGKADCYAELIGGQLWRQTLTFARKVGLPVVATNGVYFQEEKDHELHQLLRAIDLNTKLSRLDSCEVAPESAWLKSSEEMASVFPHIQEALENTEVIANKCQYRLPCESTLDAAYDGLVAENSVMGQLRQQCMEGAVKRYGSVTPEVQRRLDYELDIIGCKGFGSVFLIMEDIVKQSPRTCGRGSAAASIVSYTLGITHVEPLQHNLFFERFLNPGRKDPPDIDVDFPWDERDDIFDYVFEKYGESKAAMVSNHVGFRLRAAVREVAKVYGLPEGEIKQVTDRLSHLWTWNDQPIEELIATHPLFKGMDMSPPWPEVLERASRVRGMVRHLSVHCGGVVIVPDALNHYVPVERAPKGVQIIQWEKDQTEDSGLVKMDLLGNRSLAVIRDALAAITRNTGQVIAYEHFNPLDDFETQDIIRKGDTIGVFYIESPAMRQLQKKTDVGDYEHLVIHSSIIRPAANEYINAYVQRLKGDPYDPLHPLLDEVLHDTYGIMVYQEDVTRVAMKLAGFSPEDGDGLRKTLSKKRNARKLTAYQQQFMKGASVNGVPVETADQIWEMILSFAGYSFCKPHSASYALVSFKSAYLRAHYPAEFMAGVISNQGGYYSTFAYLSEARRMGLTILPPDINQSEKHFVGWEKSIRVGLMQLRELKATALERILSEREKGGTYASLDNLIHRTGLDPSDLRVLIKAGCLDGIARGRSRAELLWQMMSGRNNRTEAAQMGLGLFEEEVMRIPDLGDYDSLTLIRHEVEVLGFPLSVHPLVLFEPNLQGLNYVKGKDLHKFIGKRVTTIGWWVTNKMVYTRQEEAMSFISFEDTTAIYETIFFPPAFRRFCARWTQVRPYILHGTVEDDLGAISLHVDDMQFLDERKPKHTPQVKDGRLPWLQAKGTRWGV